MRSRREARRNQVIAAFTVVLLLLSIIIGSIVFGTIHAKAASAQTSYKYYTSIQIKQGDTLWNIANTYMTDGYRDISDYINEIRSINHILDDDIHAGEYLTVPYYSDEYLD